MKKNLTPLPPALVSQPLKAVSHPYFNIEAICMHHCLHCVETLLSSLPGYNEGPPPKLDQIAQDMLINAPTRMMN